MSEEKFTWEDGSPRPPAAASWLFGGPFWVPTNSTAMQGTTPDHSSFDCKTGVETGDVGPLADNDYANEVRRNMSVVVAILILLPLFQFTPATTLSNFYARKLTHVTMGACLLASQPIGHLYMKLIIFAVGISTVISCFVMPLRFSKKGDKGIISYIVIVCVWVLFDLPLAVLGPMFYADPCGAIVGTIFKSSRWIGNKTVDSRRNEVYTLNTQWSSWTPVQCFAVHLVSLAVDKVAGSIAVFVATLLTLFSATSWTDRIVLATICSLLETVGGPYDNALIAVPLIVYFFVSQNQSTG